MRFPKIPLAAGSVVAVRLFLERARRQSGGDVLRAAISFSWRALSNTVSLDFSPMA